jgi:hypothetical protein
MRQNAGPWLCDQPRGDEMGFWFSSRVRPTFVVAAPPPDGCTA